MLSFLLARVASRLPSSAKYKLSALRRVYTFLLRSRRPVVQLPTIAGSVNWEIDELTTQAYLLGSYEHYMQDAFARFVKPGAVVYDVGAHAGYHSLICGLLVGLTGRVIAFEPHPLNFNSIQRQLTLNPEMNVMIIPWALSDVCSTVRLNTALNRSQVHISDAGDLAVESKTIDYLVVETGLLPAPDVIKIDVEGYEGSVLQGALKTIQLHKPIILCDHHDSLTYSAVEQLIAPMGYEVSNGPLVISVPRVGRNGNSLSAAAKF